MKTLKILLFALLTVVLPSCHNTSEPIYLQQKFTQLNTVLAPWQKDNDLLPWKGPNHVDIINSVEDVYATQTERFIEENPNWLNVDFSSKSIISIRNILFSVDYWQFTEVLRFAILNKEHDSYEKEGDYHIWIEESYTTHDSEAEDEDKSQYRICQIAIVTDKIPSDAHILLDWGTRVTPKASTKR